MSDEDVSFLEQSDFQGTEYNVSNVIIFILMLVVKRMPV